MPGLFFKELAATASGTHSLAGLWFCLFNFALPAEDGPAIQPGHACEFLHAAISVLGSQQPDEATAPLFIQ